MVLATIEEGLKAVGGLAMTPDMKTKQAKPFSCTHFSFRYKLAQLDGLEPLDFARLLEKA